MRLSLLEKAGLTLAERAARRARDRLLARTPTPPGVITEPHPNGILLTGKRLRQRIITDPKLRNLFR